MVGLERICWGGGTLLEIARWSRERREKGRSIMDDGIDDYNRNVLFVIVTIYSYMCMICCKSVKNGRDEVDPLIKIGLIFM